METYGNKHTKKHKAPTQNKQTHKEAQIVAYSKSSLSSGVTRASKSSSLVIDLFISGREGALAEWPRIFFIVLLNLNVLLNVSSCFGLLFAVDTHKLP